MKDKMMSALIRLALCPGKCNNSDVCNICMHKGESTCEDHLRQEAMQLLQEHEAKKNSPVSSAVSLEVRISEILYEIGVPAHLKGYKYIRRAIEHVVKNPDIIDAITKELYPKISQEFKTTPSRVERAIRHAIEVAWDRGDLDVLHKWFGATVCSLKGKPTNSEFLALISDKIILEVKHNA